MLSYFKGSRAPHTGPVHLNFVDFLLLGIVLLGAASGWARGFLFSALDLLTLAAGLAAAFAGYREVAGWASLAGAPASVWTAPLAFVAVFLVAHFALGALVLRLAARLPGRVHGHLLNRTFGLVPGAVNGAVHAVVAAVLLLTLPLGARVGGWAQDSALAPRLAAPAEWVEARLAPIFDPAVQRTLQALTVRPESHERIALDFRVAKAPARPELESRMLEMVNAERRAAGLKPLKPDVELVQVARAHSQDMLARGYFAHVSPQGEDLGQRLKRARVSYLSAGENLALAPTLHSAHTGLMHSPGHRANILRPQFGRLGVGILDAGSHGLMVTQAFRN